MKLAKMTALATVLVATTAAALGMSSAALAAGTPSKNGIVKVGKCGARDGSGGKLGTGFVHRGTADFNDRTNSFTVHDTCKDGFGVMLEVRKKTASGVETTIIKNTQGFRNQPEGPARVDFKNAELVLSVIDNAREDQPKLSSNPVPITE